MPIQQFRLSRYSYPHMKPAVPSHSHFPHGSARAL